MAVLVPFQLNEPRDLEISVTNSGGTICKYSPRSTAKREPIDHLGGGQNNMRSPSDHSRWCPKPSACPAVYTLVQGGERNGLPFFFLLHLLVLCFFFVFFPFISHCSNLPLFFISQSFFKVNPCKTVLIRG